MRRGAAAAGVARAVLAELDELEGAGPGDRAMSPPRSITAPWPAKMLRAVPGATIARVTPPARLTAIESPSG